MPANIVGDNKAPADLATSQSWKLFHSSLVNAVRNFYIYYTSDWNNSETTAWRKMHGGRCQKKLAQIATVTCYVMIQNFC